MALYVHSYLVTVSNNAEHLVLERSATSARLLVLLLGGTGIGCGVVGIWLRHSQSRLALGVAALVAIVGALLALIFARSERVVFDRSTRLVHLTNGQKIPFQSISQLVLQAAKDSDGDTAWGLALEANGALYPLSSMWCWDEQKVRAIAALIAEKYPEIRFSG